MTVTKGEDNEDGSYSIFIGSKEIFRGSQEEAEEAVKKATGATLGLGVGVGIGRGIGSLAVATPLAYLLLPIYLGFCALISKKLEEDQGK